MDTGTRIVRDPISRAQLSSLAEGQFGDMIKAVVDVQKRVMAIGGELHSDEEAVLLDDGSEQRDLWGINIYDSMINVRPSQANLSRSVDDPQLQESIRQIVEALVTGYDE